VTTPTPDLAPDESAHVATGLRAGLADYDLSDEDQTLLELAEGGGAPRAQSGPLPVLAVIGRPNVGKSTLVNRVLGRREAVVEDVPGVTRDRVAYEGEWTGRRFTIVDTGGWERDVTGLHLRVAEQAEIAIELADAVMFVVDATVGETDTDVDVVRVSRMPCRRCTVGAAATCSTRASPSSPSSPRSAARTPRAAPGGWPWWGARTSASPAC